jgi:hypothetical protein
MALSQSALLEVLDALKAGESVDILDAESLAMRCELSWPKLGRAHVHRRWRLGARYTQPLTPPAP